LAVNSVIVAFDNKTKASHIAQIAKINYVLAFDNEELLAVHKKAEFSVASIDIVIDNKFLR